MRPHDSLWDGAHDARLTGDVVDEILGGKVDRADWDEFDACMIRDPTAAVRRAAVAHHA